VNLKQSQQLPPHIHFIGVGGIGMSALAMILVKSGYSVSGSDNKKSSILKELAANDINIFKSQEAKNIDKIIENNNKSNNILVVISSAIRKDNLELNRAKKYDLSIKHRSEVLALLIDQNKSVVVSGSHGKTTTSTYITTILSLANKKPTAIIGGIVPIYKKNYNFGDGELLIAEADESDGSLIKFNPDIGIITNIELEHVDYYKNLEELIKTMKQFGKNCKCLIGNHDCQNIRNNIKVSTWFSTKIIDKVDFSLIQKESNGCGTIAEYYEDEKFIDLINIPIPGMHNLSNTIAAIAACREAGIVFEEIKKTIELLQLPGRRFDYKGLWQDRLIVDDYAHHPSEVDAAISMASLMIKTKNNIFPIPPNRLVTVFQPHRFSRTKKFEKNFAKILIKSDLVFIMPIYSAGEDSIQGINHHSLAYQIKRLKPSLEIYTPDNNQELIKLMKEKTKPKDLIIMMGAGNINMVWEKLVLESINSNLAA
tara:strand:- start:870 stop:2315 length:1446 start_codon:yes stop_codon:yes gene_type:complete